MSKSAAPSELKTSEPKTSALQAWAETVFDGHDDEVDLAPGRAAYEPEDLISVYSGAAESARHRNEGTRPVERPSLRMYAAVGAGLTSRLAADPA